MKNIKTYLILLTICLTISNLNSYTQSFGSNVLGINKSTTDSTVKTITKTPKLFKPNVRVNLGTSFTTFGNNFTGFQSFIAPEISMPVSKKTEVSFGMSYTSMQFRSGNENTTYSGNNNYGSVYVSGTYHVNDKFSVKATGYKTFLLNPGNFNNENQNSYLDFSNQGAIVDLEYRITENFRINASFQYHEQNNPNFFYGNPYGGYGGYNGFSSPSSVGFGGFNSFGPGF